MHSRISIPIDAVLGELQVVRCCTIPMRYAVADERNRMRFEDTNRCIFTCKLLEY